MRNRFFTNYFSLALLITLILFACGGPEITFPQGPTSGAGDLGFGNFTTAIEPFPRFNLRVEVNENSDSFEFQWTVPTNVYCPNFQVVLTQTPTVADPSAISIIKIIGETPDFFLEANEELGDFLDDNANASFSAVVLCVESILPYPHSSFETVSGF